MRKKDLIALFGMNILFASLPYYFISLLLLRKIGFSFSEIAVLGVITQSFGMIFDIPMSLLTLKYGYKKILLLSHLFLFFGLLILGVGTYVFAIISAVLLGLSESLSSGVLASFNFEMFSDETRYEWYLKKVNTLKYIFIALASIGSPYLLDISVELPLYGSAIFVAISGLLLLSLKDSQQMKGEETETISPHMKVADLKTAPWLLILLGVIFSTVVMINNSYATILLNNNGVSLKFLGWILFLFNMSMALGSHIKVAWKTIFLIPGFVLCISFFNSPWILTLVFLLIRVLNASYLNQFLVRFNKSIHKNRPIYWSIYNFAISISFILADLLAGLIGDTFGLKMIYRIFGILGVLYIFWYFVRLKGRLAVEH